MTTEIYELTPTVKVHTHACGEGGIFVNAYLVETPQGVIAVDATLSVSTSKALRARFESLNKPLLGVLITHPHPDHVAGLAHLVTDDTTPIYATAEAKALMEKIEAPKRAQWTPVFGEEWVEAWRYPNREIKHGDALTFDGVTYTIHDLGRGGHCDANAIWLARAGSRQIVFLSDLIFNGVHSYIADGGVLDWLANLERVEQLCAVCVMAFPGHGAAARPEQLITAQRSYLLSYLGALKAVTADLPRDDKFDEVCRGKRIDVMKQRLPGGWLEFLIGLSADVVLAELRGN